MNNRDAAASGDQRMALEVLRDTLAEQLDMTEASIHAQLAAQYRATLAELAALPAAEGKSPVVSIAERIAAANSAA